MGQQFLRRGKKSNRVRQPRVQFKRLLIHPLGMDRECERSLERLKYIDTQTTNFRSRRLVDPQQFLAKLRLFSGTRFKPDENVNGHAAPPESEYATGAAHESYSPSLVSLGSSSCAFGTRLFGLGSPLELVLAKLTPLRLVAYSIPNPAIPSPPHPPPPR